MTRFILAILIALSLIGGSGPAFAAPEPDCSLAEATMGSPADHDSMGCCTPDCAVSCPAALIPPESLPEPSVQLTETRAWTPKASALHSVSPTAIDPPPKPSLA